jgi:TnpA family transposase
MNIMSIMKKLQNGDRSTSLTQAITEIDRAHKIFPMMTYSAGENKRRSA